MSDPEPGPDEVVIRVRACGICGSDFHFVETDADGYSALPGLVRAPVVTGHEFAGVVEAVGSAVSDFAPGDHVCAEEIAWCGDCLACRAGRPNNCTRIEELGFSFDGAHAEYVVARARYCWSLAPLLEAGLAADKIFQLGALVEPTGVAYVAMFVSAGGFMPGSSVGVVGAGPIGLAAIALATGRRRGPGRRLRDRRGPPQARVGDGRRRGLRSASAGEGGIATAAREQSHGRGIDVSSRPVAPRASPRRWPRRSRPPASSSWWAGSARDRPRPGVAHRSRRGDPRLDRALGFGTFGHVIDLMAAGRLDMTRIVSATVDLDGGARLLDGTPHREPGKVNRSLGLLR